MYVITLFLVDQEMPGADFFGTGLANAISSGQVSQARLDDMATRILTGLYLAGAMNNPSPTGIISFSFFFPPPAPALQSLRTNR